MQTTRRGVGRSGPAAMACAIALCLALPFSALSADAPPAPADAPPPEAVEDEFLDEFDSIYEEAEEETVSVPDPLEPINRVMFQFNDTFYFWLAKPVAIGYRTVIPAEVRIPVKNFIYNAFAPIRIANCLLQGKGRAAGTEFLRFFINTTAGVGGFGDVADRYPELAPRDEDLGQTMAVYGIGNGAYLVIPVFGFTTLRDAAGWVGDRYLSPFTYAIDTFEGGVAFLSFRTINELSFRIGDYETVKAAAIDPYVAFRSGYIQFRNSKIRE